MIEFICDGSRKGMKIGAGIVKVAGEKVSGFHFYQKINEKTPVPCHEAYAIYKCLELIERGEVKKSVIYNDEMTLVAALNRQVRLSISQSERTGMIFSKLHDLRAKGYNITIKHINHLKEMKHHSEAHKLSRKYIKKITHKISIEEFLTKNNISFVLPSEPIAELGKTTERKKKVKETPTPVPSFSRAMNSTRKQNYLGCTFLSSNEVFKANKTILKDKYPKEDLVLNKLLVSLEEFKSMDQFVFQRMKKNVWGVFSKEQRLIFASTDNFFELSISFFRQLQESRIRNVKINGHYFSCLKGCYKGMFGLAVTEHDRIKAEASYNILVELLKNFQIETFIDFYFAS